MIGRARTLLVALLAMVVAMRLSLAEPASLVTQRIAAAPGEAVRSAGDTWTVAGTLGGASVQQIRELPYAAFVWLGTETGVSASTVEGSWRALVLALAVVGAVRLARGLSGGSTGRRDESWAAWVAAVVFALGAVLVPTLLRSPTDGLAAAALPWVVAPLLLDGRGWRPVLASATWVGVAGVGSPGWALAALAAGAVAVLPRDRWEVPGAVRWLLLAGAASAWWVVLMVWEAAHAVDVSALTRGGLRAESAAAVGRPDLPLLVLVAVTAGPVLVAVAAVALRSPDLRRRFVLGLLVVSAAAVLGGWVGAWRLPVAAPTGAGLPSSMAGPLLGLLGLVGLVAWCPLVADLSARLRRVDAEARPVRRQRVVTLLVVAVVAVAAVAGPAASVADPGAVPAGDQGLLNSLARWSAAAGPGRVLVLPPETGSTDLPGLGTALGDRPWVGRDHVPTSGDSGTAAIDEVVTRLSRGDGGPGTLSGLHRLGISYVVVRLGGPTMNDRVNPAGLVRAALRSVGARRLAVLRDDGADGAELDPILDFGVRSSTAQIEVWAPPATASAWVYDGRPAEVVGDAGSVSDLADAGVLRDRAIRLRAPSDDASDVLSDSARRRDVDQRVPVDPYGPDLTLDESRSVVPPDAAPVTSATLQLTGAASVTASSSLADLEGQLRVAGTDATAAIDANAYTSWLSRRSTGVGEWWQVRFADPTSVNGTTVHVVRNLFGGYAVSKIRVDADDQSTSYDVPDDGLVALNGVDEVKRLRITISGIEGTFGPLSSVGIVEVAIPAASVTHRVGLVDAPASSWLLAARIGSRTTCVPAVPRGDDDDAAPGTACNAGVNVGGPDTSTLDRTISVASPTSVAGRVWLVASAAGAAGALADGIADPSVVATSESVATRDLVTRPQAAADDDLTTAWRPAPADRNPVLTLEWTTPADLTGVRLVAPTQNLGSRPTRVQITAEVIGRRTDKPVKDLVTEAEVAVDGTIALPTIRTRQVSIKILDDTDVPSIDSVTGGTRRTPVAVGEVELLGGPSVTYDYTRTKKVGCSDGPTVTVGGVVHGTRLEFNAAQIVGGATVRATICARIALPAGESMVTMPATFEWQPRGVLLSARDTLDEDAEVGPGPTPVGVDVIGQTTRGDVLSLDVGASDIDRALVLALPSGSGWRASVAGRGLEPVTIDGWAQGWIVPAGSGEVAVRYSPGADVGRVSLGAASGWLLVVLLLAGVGVGSWVCSVVSRARSWR